ncbi:MAG: 2-oxoacid:ferredoxin oxidoreductase subunit beta [Patescibacteria group bacterium]|nr:2-oxoacid:ferredoxin oxidoreductase subunit beta [Patescibacteria group bacterium]
MPTQTKQTTPVEAYNTQAKPTWCPGCGDFGIWMGIKSALSELNLPPHMVAIVYGIGCAGNMASTLKCYGFHSLHGRTLPVATGIKLANPKLAVLTVAGDGDFYGEGGNHFLHAARYNSDINAIVCDNRLFSLTTGQASPTSAVGMISKTTPFGEIKEPLNPVALAIIAGATFVARVPAFDPALLKETIKQAINHKGFALINVLQQCVTFNKTNTVEWYKERIYNLNDAKHDINNKEQALAKALETEKIPVGVFYKVERPSYEEKLDLSPAASAKDEKIVFPWAELKKEFI